MAKASKPKKPRAPKYEQPLVAKEGSFLDIMKASVKDAEKRTAEKKEGE